MWLGSEVRAGSGLELRIQSLTVKGKDKKPHAPGQQLPRQGSPSFCCPAVRVKDIKFSYECEPQQFRLWVQLEYFGFQQWPNEEEQILVLCKIHVVFLSWAEEWKKLFKNDHKSTGSNENEGKNAYAGNVMLSELCLHRDWSNILPRVRRLSGTHI